MKNKYKKFEGKLVEVEWADACSIEISKKDIDRAGLGGMGLLAINNTYGLLYKIYTNVVVIVTEKTTHDDKLECTIIPTN